MIVAKNYFEVKIEGVFDVFGRHSNQ